MEAPTLQTADAVHGTEIEMAELTELVSLDESLQMKKFLIHRDYIAYTD